MLQILKRVWQKFAESFNKPINKAAAVTLSIYTLLWGIWLANPYWEVFKSSSIYEWLNSVAPETFWGTLAVSVGIVMIYGVAKSSYNSFTIAAFVGFLHWLIIGMGYFISDWQNPGGLTAWAMAVYCAAIYLNLRVNHNLHFENPADNI